MSGEKGKKGAPLLTLQFGPIPEKLRYSSRYYNGGKTNGEGKDVHLPIIQWTGEGGRGKKTGAKP